MPTVTVTALLALTALSGCALPAEGVQGREGDTNATADATSTADANSGVIRLEQPRFSGMPAHHSFVIDADGAQVMLAALHVADEWTLGPAEWVGSAWTKRDLIVRRDVDVHQIPLELLERQGQPFVGADADGKQCKGYLGELSVVRMLSIYNARDFLGVALTEAEDKALFAADRWLRPSLSGPPSERLRDPELVWRSAAERAFLVARWEREGDCTPAAWGAHPDHMPAVFETIEIDKYTAQAQRLFRAHPEYKMAQTLYEKMHSSLRNHETGEPIYPSGLWDQSTFSARVLEDAQGRRRVLAAAGEAACNYGPALSVLFDVSDEDNLVEHEAPWMPSSFTQLLETVDHKLHLVVGETFYSLDGTHHASVGPVQIGCGC